jgi:uncharacterized membrane protein YraQ (UPF0718 family)
VPAVLAAGAVAAMLAARHSDALSGATVVFASISMEALPFVLLGAIVSAVLGVLVPDRVFARVGTFPRALQLPLAALGGIAFPVCECGSVPVARRLTMRGLEPAAAFTFMLAAPILNPVVIVSTVIAFRGRDPLGMVAARLGLGFVVAVTAGLILGRRVDLSARPDDVCGCESGEHEHHRHGRVRTIVDHATGDVAFMGRYVVVGAALAALVQTVVPTSALAGVAGNSLLAPLVLMLAAFLLSLCSSADAFVGASFVQFGPAAQLGFLTLGPVLDLKLALLYGATFGRASVLRVALVAVPIIFAGSLLLNLLVLS